MKRIVLMSLLLLTLSCTIEEKSKPVELTSTVDTLYINTVSRDSVYTETKTEPCYKNYYNVNFEDYTAGDVIKTIALNDDVTIDVSTNILYPVIFDSGNPTGNDDDLLFNQGNILVISDTGIPDDYRDGGSIDFEFSEPTFIESLRLLDIEEGAAIVTNHMTMLHVEPTLDNTSREVNIGEEVQYMTISLYGSGAVDDIKISKIICN